jgi:hypothetical protein
MNHGRLRGRLRVKHEAIFGGYPNRQARGWDKPWKWFIIGLERFVNTGDSLEHYRALGKAFESFWPLPILDHEGRDLSWAPEAHHLFLLYRNLVRRFWTRDPEIFNDQFATQLLFGTVTSDEMQRIFSGDLGADRRLETALAPLLKSYSGMQIRGGPASLARFRPDWSARSVDYVSQLDFQRAVWLFFRESWRAKVCPRCSTYFFVQKSAQLYCSLSCSSAAHRISSLRWWYEEGSRRRVAGTKVKRRGIRK